MLKTIWSILLRLFRLEKKGIDEGQLRSNARYTGQYEDISKINLTSIFAAKLTTLAVSESTAEIAGDHARAELLKGCMEQFWAARKKLTARMLGVGGCVAAPYVKDGAILFGLIPQDRFVITEKTGERITGAVVLADMMKKNNRSYYRLTDYNVQADTLYITNRVVDENGAPAIVAEWKDIQDHAISGVDRALLAFFKSPVDNRHTMDDYGVPVTYGCDGLMQEIQECLEAVRKEFKEKSVRIFADERLFRVDPKTGERIVPSGAFVAGNMGDSKAVIEVFSPEMRESSYYARLLNLFELLEKAVGTSKGILTAPESRGATATEIKAGIYDTYALVADIRAVLEKGVRDYIYCCDVLANYYGLAPMGEYEIKFDWSYSMIESSAETWAQLKDAEAMGVKSKAEVRAWLTGETLEEAEEKVSEIKKNEPAVDDLV